MSSARRVTSGMRDALRSSASIIVHYISSDFSAFVVLKVYTYRPCVLGTPLLSLK